MLNNYATPPDIPGSTRNYDFAREFIKHGHKVTIFTSSFNHRALREERCIGKHGYLIENIDEVKFVWLKTSPRYLGNDWRRVVNMLSYTMRVITFGLKLNEKPEVILASTPHPFTGLAGWLLAKLRKAAFILQVHDLWPQTLVDIGGYDNRSPIVILLKILEKFLYQRARKIIIFHPQATKYIATMGIPAAKIVHIPNGVSPELFAKTGVSLPAELDEIIAELKARQKLIAVYTGTHTIVNALDTILETAKLLQSQEAMIIHFLLIGEGTEKQRLIDTAHQLRLANISFFKPIPKNAIPELIRKSDIGVLTWKKSDLYTQYGMSTNKLWDYMMCAKPIVWAIDSANDPVADSHCGITVPPEDPAAMAAAIIQICNLSSEERQRMGLRGHDYVMKYNSVPVLALRLLEVLEEAQRH